MLACQTGPILAEAEPTFRLLRWLALRGSPPGTLDRPVMRLPRPLLPYGPDLSVLCSRSLYDPMIFYASFVLAI
jgi:hypothetical protein